MLNEIFIIVKYPIELWGQDKGVLENFWIGFGNLTPTWSQYWSFPNCKLEYSARKIPRNKSQPKQDNGSLNNPRKSRVLIG